MKQRSSFTLIEMLTVVAIIAILAGIIVPVVLISQRNGRITQAKSDIQSIATAIKQIRSKNTAVLALDGSNYYAGGKAADKKDENDANNKKYTYVKIEGDTYDAFIAELSVPKNKKLPSSNTQRFNKQRRKYLDPKSSFNPDEDYDSTNNKEALYRDPWGNPYVVYINVSRDDYLKIPDTSKTIAGGTAIYSFGPNGEDDKGCNSDLDTCIKSGDSNNHKDHDDVASWNL